MLGRIIISVIAFSVLVTVFMSAFTDLSNTYNPTVDPLFVNATKNFNETLISTIKTDVDADALKGMGLNQTLNPTLTPENQFWSSSLSTLRIIPNTFDLITKLTGDIANYIGVPYWMMTAFLMVIIIFIVFTIISSVLRGNIL